jgi:hypothetical protein
MNIQARSIKLNKSRKKNNTRRTIGSKLGIVFRMIIVMAFVFGIATLRISINQWTVAEDREADRLVRQIAQLDREIENYKLKKEKLSSWPHIKDRIQKFNLALRMPEPFQVQNLTVIYDPAGKEKTSGERKTAMLSQR